MDHKPFELMAVFLAVVFAVSQFLGDSEWLFKKARNSELVLMGREFLAHCQIDPDLCDLRVPRGSYFASYQYVDGTLLIEIDGADSPITMSMVKPVIDGLQSPWARMQCSTIDPKSITSHCLWKNNEQ